jgi:hypothetical protein
MYYKIEQSTDIEIIGWSPQIQDAIFPVHIDSDPRSTKSFWFESADLNKLIFPEPILHSRAKLVDYIRCSVVGNRFMPLVSKKIKEIILSGKHNSPQFIPIKVHYRNNIVDGYYYLNAYDFKYECIDLEKSIIKWDYGYANRHKNIPIAISSSAVFMEILGNLMPPVGINIDPLILSESADFYDFFSLSWVKGGVGYYISDKLKVIFENEGVTGINYLGINEVC